MGTTDDYSTGLVLENIRKALHVFDSTEGSLNNNEQAVLIQKKIQEFNPKILSVPEASVYIRKASIIALGERVCQALHPVSVSTESVFLDELAEAMISSGQARLASIEDAEQTLKKHSSRPLIISMVSGRYQEICASYPLDCVYWKAEKSGLHCLLNRKKADHR